MAVPDVVRRLAEDQSFWASYFFAGSGEEEYPDLADCQIEFAGADGYRLSLNLDEYLGYFSLGLRHPGLEKDAKDTEIAWDDQGHWHPHVLRWSELDLLCRVIALDQPDLPHPGLPLVLLYRFAPICDDGDARLAFPLIEAALRALPGLAGREGACRLSEEDIDRFQRRSDLRSARISWRYQEDLGWYPQQSEDKPQHHPLYTLRHPDNSKFPFAALETLFDLAARRYAASIDPAWLEPATVLPLARSIHQTGDLAGVPALGAALRDAGCTHPTILAALTEPFVPARACWVVESLLSQPTGSLITRHFGEPQPAPPADPLKVSIPVPAGSNYARSAHPILDAVRQALTERGLFDRMGGRSARFSLDGGPYTTTCEIWVRADLDTAAAVAAEVLRATAPPETRLTIMTQPQHEIDWR